MKEMLIWKTNKRGAFAYRLITILGKKFTVRNEILLLGVLYTVMHGGILLATSAIYWDDWILYRSAPSVILDTFRQAGAMFNFTGYLHIAMLSVGVKIGEQCFIGVNATLRDHIKIGDKCVIGAGALLLSDAEPEGVYLGNATERSRVPSTRLRKI